LTLPHAFDGPASDSSVGSSYALSVRYVKVVTGLAVVAATVAVAVVFAADGSMPDKYRFTGWMAPSANSSPRHVTFEGDAPVLRFADSGNLTASPTAYQVCVVKVGTTQRSCQTGTARIDTRNSTLPLKVNCCGRFLATWYVQGRAVARWPFLYHTEGG
jgi:hypothetical protein